MAFHLWRRPRRQPDRRFSFLNGLLNHAPRWLRFLAEKWLRRLGFIFRRARRQPVGEAEERNLFHRAGAGMLALENRMSPGSLSAAAAIPAAMPIVASFTHNRATITLPSTLERIAASAGEDRPILRVATREPAFIRPDEPTPEVGTDLKAQAIDVTWSTQVYGENPFSDPLDSSQWFANGLESTGHGAPPSAGAESEPPREGDASDGGGSGSGVSHLEPEASGGAGGAPISGNEELAQTIDLANSGAFERAAAAELSSSTADVGSTAFTLNQDGPVILGTDRASGTLSGFAPSTQSTGLTANPSGDASTLTFEVNRGQADPAVRFTSQDNGYNLMLTPDAAILVLGAESGSPDTLHMEFLGANPATQVIGVDQRPGTIRQFTGIDPVQLHVPPSSFGRVHYLDIYANIDLEFYGTPEGQLEYDWRLEPGADVDAIRLGFQGAQSVAVDAAGRLHLRTAHGDIVQHAPIIYQDIDGQRHFVSGGYVIHGGNEVGFHVGVYDHSRPLVIDPLLDTLTAQGVTFSATEGAAFSGLVATFQDTDPGAALGNYSAIITWETGHSTVGIIGEDGSGGFTVSGTYTYPNAGQYAVAVTISSLYSQSVVANSTGNVANAPLSASGMFDPVASYPVGSTPDSIAAQDFDGDGAADLAVANFNSGNINVLSGNGDGTFANATDYAVGSGPNGFAIGDFHGPGVGSASSSGSNEVAITPALGVDTVWVDDATPTGAILASDGGDSWTWVSSNPVPFSGSLASQSNIASGEHQHYFYGATDTLSVGLGDKLFAYVYLDPANPPSEVMLQWHDSSGSWEHRAYWGANNIGWGTNGTNSRRFMGALPATGGWVRLEVAASLVGLEGITVDGMAFTLFDGRATWDKAGIAEAQPGTAPGVVASAGDDQISLRWTMSAGATSYNVYRSTSPGGQGSTPYATGLTGTSFNDTSVTNGETYYYQVAAVSPAGEGSRSTEFSATPATGLDTIWVDDVVPAGATLFSSGGDAWNWSSSNPYSGSVASQSNIAAGEHQHYFLGASDTLSVAAGDKLFAYVNLDPLNPPSEVMLQWHDTTGSWDHRAYWGANSIWDRRHQQPAFHGGAASYGWLGAAGSTCQPGWT